MASVEYIVGKALKYCVAPNRFHFMSTLGTASLRSLHTVDPRIPLLPLLADEQIARILVSYFLVYYKWVDGGFRSHAEDWGGGAV